MPKSQKTIPLKVVISRELYEKVQVLAEGHNCTLQQYLNPLLTRIVDDELLKLEAAEKAQRNSKADLNRLREAAFQKRASQ